MIIALSPHQLIPINAENIRRLAPACCYSDNRLRKLLGDGCTALEVATRRDGRWAAVSDEDRIRFICLEGVMTPKSQRLFAVGCGRWALQTVKDAGHQTHPDSWAACDVGERYAHGQATDTELQEAAKKACVAAAIVVASGAAWMAGMVARAAACAAVSTAAARAALWSAAVSARSAALGARSRASERARQVQWWVEFLTKEAKS